MKDLFLETLSAPKDLGDKTLRPADAELRTISDNVKGLVVALPAFGADDVGVQLVSTYTKLQANIVDRATKDAAAIVTASDALAAISDHYATLVEPNTPSGT